MYNNDIDIKNCPSNTSEVTKTVIVLFVVHFR